MDNFKEVFKYTDTAGAEKILINGTLKFSTPKTLNDPYDLSEIKIFGYNFLDSKLREEEIEEHIKLLFTQDDLPAPNNNSLTTVFFYLRSHLIKLPEEKQKEAFNTLRKELLEEEPDFKQFEESDKVAREFFNKSFASDVIFCGSKKFNNMPLWAHYAENHKGVVFKFVPNIAKDSVLRTLREVKYTSAKPVIYRSPKDLLHKSLFGDLNENLLKFITEHVHTKGLDWKYEDEIRIFVANVPGRPFFQFYNYQADELAALYLGYNMKPSDKEKFQVFAIAKNPKIEIYEMIKPSGANGFELNSSRIK